MDLFDADLVYESEQLAPTPRMPTMLALVAPEIVVVGDSTLRNASSPGGAAGIAVSHLADTAGLPLQASTVRSVVSVLANRARNADCVLVVDHGRGVATDPMRQLMTARRAELPTLIVDAQDARPWAPTRPELVVLTATAAAGLAQTAADVTTRRPDSPVCTTADLTMRLAGDHPDALPWPDFQHLVRGHQRAGRRVVVTSGTFDQLRGVDIEHLNYARRLGDVLVIALHSDATARRVAHHRPLYPARCRAAALSALSCVDHVTITDDEVPVDLLERLCPDRYLRV
jgi:hypothetical protein